MTEIAGLIERLEKAEDAVLRAIGPDGGDLDWLAYTFAGISRMTGLDVLDVRAACRNLTLMGLAAYERGLMTDDGELAGSGYRATDAGKALLRTLEPNNG